MPYSQNEKSTGLETQTTLADADLVVHGDASDSGRAKAITWTNFKAQILDYIDGVTATLTNKTIDGSSNTITNAISIETPSGTINGSNAAFTVSNEPIFVTVNGIIYSPSAGYTYAGGTITFSAAPQTSSVIRSFY